MKAARPSQPAKQQNKSAALLGLAFDAEDEQKRLTRGPNFVLAGGSQETHTRMQETALKVNEQLEKRGKRLEDVELGELHDIVRRAAE